MADPTQGFVPEDEIGIKITKKDGEDYMVLMRFDRSDQVMDYIAVRLQDFMQHSVQPIWMDDDEVSREMHASSQRVRAMLGLQTKSWEEWYIKQPVVIRFTSGKGFRDYRMTFHNWMTCELEFKKILDHQTPLVPMEIAIEHTREQPHKLKEAHGG